MILTRQNENSEQGFTLLEVLIALAILIFICFAIFQATTETYKLRDSLTIEGDLNNSLVLSMAVIQRDLNLIYSPKIAMPEKKPDPAQIPGQPPINPAQDAITDDLTQTYTFWSVALQPTGLRPSRLIGTETKLSFISLSNVRIYKEAQESEFAKITYEIRRDENNTDNPGTSVLVKTQSPNAFDNNARNDTQAITYNVLSGIKSFSFFYHQKEGDTWKVLKNWDTDREETKNLFPDIIEIKLEVLGPKKFSFEGDYKFRPEIPLNGLYPSY
jgi:hypothetical protein